MGVAALFPLVVALATVTVAAQPAAKPPVPSPAPAPTPAQIPTAPVPGTLPAAGGAPMPPLEAVSFVDWRSRQLVVEVQARPPGAARLWRDVAALATRLAEQEAGQILLETLTALPLGESTVSLATFFRAQPQWASYALDASRRATTCATRLDADGQVRLQRQLDLEGGGGRLGPLWVALRAAQTTLGQLQAPLAAPASSAELRPPEVWRRTAAAEPTGVVVVATGQRFVPCLWPRLVDGHGRELFGPASLTADALAARGVAALHSQLEVALRDPRVASQARVVRATAVTGGSRCTLVVAEADVADVLALGPLLREGRLALVVDLPPPPETVQLNCGR